MKSNKKKRWKWKNIGNLAEVGEEGLQTYGGTKLGF